MLYDNDQYTVFDHHEQSTGGLEPVDPHTPGSQPPRMDSQVDVTGAILDELASDEHFYTLYSDDTDRNGCGCGSGERENEGCGCGRGDGDR